MSSLWVFLALSCAFVFTMWLISDGPLRYKGPDKFNIETDLTEAVELWCARKIKDE